MSRLREAAYPQTAFVEARGDLCSWWVFLRETSPPIPSSRDCTSRRNVIGDLSRVSSPRIGIFAPANEARKQIQYP
jgi:hypothetical protein